MTQPLISVMMPCYNASDTLARALASLQAQTYSNWECVFVDDGSTDNPLSIIKQFEDARIRTFKFQYNQGRGAARQLALDNARGDYLCMLDADDWYYPDKLEKQLAFMEDSANKPIVLCAVSTAIIDACNKLIGVRQQAHPLNQEAVIKTLPNRIANLSFTHPSIMIRMDNAKQANYATELHQAEDIDWLWRVLPNHSYALLPNIGYAYNEYASSDRDAIIGAYTQSMKVLWRHRQGAQAFVMRRIAAEFCKQTLFRLAFPLGFAKMLIAKRANTSKPSSGDIASHRKAERRINQILSQIMKP